MKLRPFFLAIMAGITPMSIAQKNASTIIPPSLAPYPSLKPNRICKPLEGIDDARPWKACTYPFSIYHNLKYSALHNKTLPIFYHFRELNSLFGPSSRRVISARRKTGGRFSCPAVVLLQGKQRTVPAFVGTRGKVTCPRVPIAGRVANKTSPYHHLVANKTSPCHLPPLFYSSAFKPFKVMDRASYSRSPSRRILFNSRLRDVRFIPSLWANSFFDIFSSITALFCA